MTSLARGGHGVGWLRGESLRLYRLYGFFVKLKLANTEYSLLSLARALHMSNESEWSLERGAWRLWPAAAPFSASNLQAAVHHNAAKEKKQAVV